MATRAISGGIGPSAASLHIGKLLAVAVALGASSVASARIIEDSHGNVGYTSAAECEQAIAAGNAKFYRPFTSNPALLREGEASHKVMRLGDVSGYENGACDQGVGARFDRDGASYALIGSFIPFSPSMKVNAYRDASGEIVRLSMKSCDNNFSDDLPRPLGKGRVASECYADVLIPAKFETRSERVLKVPETKQMKVVPATYKTVTEQVMVRPEIIKQFPIPATYKSVKEKIQVKPASVRREPVPPTFKTVTEQMMVKPESTKVRVIQATYKTVSEQVMVSEESSKLVSYPAEFEVVTEVVKVADSYKIWKRGKAWIGQAIDVRPLRGFDVGSDGKVKGVKVEGGWAIADNARLDDDVMCLVEVPARYETIRRQVLKNAAGVRETLIPARYKTVTKKTVDQPARTETVKIPAVYTTTTREIIDTPATTRDIPVAAVYETIVKRVVDTPASVREQVTPAKYETISRRVIDRPASAREIVIPAKYEALSHKVKVEDARTERRQILCDTNATPAKIREIQSALKQAGYNPGPVDGILRSQTMRAVNQFQQAKSLPVDGFLSVETVKALGVSAN